jgi:beta-galactosidase
MIIKKNLNFMLISIVALLSFLISIKAQDDIHDKRFFDYNWKFYLGDVPSASAKDFNDANWRNLDLPHDWSVITKADLKNHTCSVGYYFPVSIVCYRKTEVTDKDEFIQPNKQNKLHFNINGPE